MIQSQLIQSELDLGILDALAGMDDPTDMRTLARAVGATPEVIRHHVLKLHKTGLIARTGGKRGPSVRYAYLKVPNKED